MKKIIILIFLLNLVNCSSGNKKDVQNSRWNENCPYTEDNCGYPFENYMYDQESIDARKQFSPVYTKKSK
jgi:hypothetical protein